MNRPFLHDPASGESLDYPALAEAVLGGPVRHRPFCRPNRISECFFALVGALALDRDLTLVDQGLTGRELAALGLDAAMLLREETVPRIRDAADLGGLLAGVRASCRSRLTLFTSGSTGLPKAVSHTLDTLGRGLRIGARHARDVWGFAYNPTHVAGVQVFLQALFNLNPLVNLFRIPRAGVLELLREHQVTHLSATPTFYRLLMPVEAELPTVRAVTVGGERTDPRLLEQLRPLFPNARFRNIYASTEAGTLLHAEGDVFSIPETLAGRIEVREGRLHVHRSLLGEFTTQLVRPDGWYDTGDAIEIVADAPLRFRIVGRERDWVNVGGNKVNPAEVELELRRHPGVREARVFARRNAVLGEALCAEVVPAGGELDEPGLRQFLASRLQPYKVPRVIRAVPSLEPSRTGKLPRDE